MKHSNLQQRGGLCFTLGKKFQNSDKIIMKSLKSVVPKQTEESRKEEEEEVMGGDLSIKRQKN